MCAAVQRPWNVVDFVLVVLGGFLGAGVALAVSLALGGGDLLLVLGLIGQYLGHLFALWLLGRHRSERDLGFALEPRDLLYLPVGLLLQLLLAVLFLPLTNLLFPNGDSVQQIGDALSSLTTASARIAAIVVAVVLAPVVEELTFRGVLVKAMSGRKRGTIMVVTALVFSAFHLAGLDPSALAAAAAIVLPQLFLVGLLLAWLTLRNGRLGPAIFVHSGFNLLAALALLLPSDLLNQIR